MPIHKKATRETIRFVQVEIPMGYDLVDPTRQRLLPGDRVMRKRFHIEQTDTNWAESDRAKRFPRTRNFNPEFHYIRKSK